MATGDNAGACRRDEPYKCLENEFVKLYNALPRQLADPMDLWAPEATRTILQPSTRRTRIKLRRGEQLSLIRGSSGQGLDSTMDGIT